MNRAERLPEQTHVVQTTRLSRGRTQLFDETNRMPFLMDLDLACQAETEMPIVVVRVAQELSVDKAAISKQGDDQMGRQKRSDLLQHWLIVLKGHFGTCSADGSPGQRNSPALVNEGGSDQHKRG